MIYVLDTNVLSDSLRSHVTVRTQIRAHRTHSLCLCQPVDYEVRRGLLRKDAKTQLHLYETVIKPPFRWIPLVDDDWRQAARLWADAVSQGKQLADIDLLVAAIAIRLNAVIVTADDDFDTLPVQRINWREPPVAQ